MSTKSIIMNKLRNRVQLIGHLGMNPEVKTLESGTKLAKFSLATNDSYVNHIVPFRFLYFFTFGIDIAVIGCE